MDCGIIYVMISRFTDRPSYDYYFNTVREALIGVRRVDNGLSFNQVQAYIARKGITHCETSYGRPLAINRIDYATAVGYNNFSPYPPAAWNWEISIFLIHHALSEEIILMREVIFFGWTYIQDPELSTTIISLYYLLIVLVMNQV